MWSVRVTPNDGYQDGPYGEASVLIGNTPPTIDSLSVDNSTPTTSETISCTGSAADQDGDPLTEGYEWTNQTTGIVIGSTATLTLSPLLAQPGDSLLCSYTVNDGTDTQTSSIVANVANGIPVITNLSIAPSTPYLEIC